MFAAPFQTHNKPMHSFRAHIIHGTLNNLHRSFESLHLAAFIPFFLLFVHIDQRCAISLIII